jgi:hypothetical protein
MTQRLLKLVNVAMTTGTDEYSVAIPSGAIEVQISCGDATNKIQVYTISVGNGGSPANAWLIEANMTFKLGTTKQDAQTLYLMSSASSIVAQVSYYLDQ